MSQLFGDSCLPQRFWDKVSPEPNSGCWLWNGAIDRGGYGRVATGNWRSAGAHRTAYTALVGPVPASLHLDHLCRVRCCVNPAHLEPVTPRENMLRGVSPHAVNARKTHCAKGHPMRDHAGRRECIFCRRAYRAKWYRERRAKLKLEQGA